jgi:protein TonB
VGSGIKPPAKIKDVPPVYPIGAVAARVEGMVVVEATINAAGGVSDAKVLRSVPMLDQAALDAVRQWVFSPTLVDGQPVPVIMAVTVTFSLK